MKTYVRTSNNIVWKDVKHVLETLLKEGHTLDEVAEMFKCTKQNISLVIKKHLPHLRKSDYGRGKRGVDKKAAKLKYIQETYGRTTWYWANDLEKAHSDFFRRKEQNAKKTKWEWSIKYSDLVYPKYCPVLGLELNWFAEARAENSPSIDRIDSTKGYIKGNVIVMSWRANRIKNDGSAEEHQKIAEFLKNYNP